MKKGIFTAKQWGVVLVMCLSFFIISGCRRPKKPLVLGFAATLTSKHSVWGVNARNGALLAIEQVNAAGGINGHRVELLVRDTEGDPDVALSVHRELVDKGVTAIIGPHYSTLALHVMPFMNESEVLMFSTGAESIELSDQDDYFARVIMSADQKAPYLAELAYTHKKLRRCVVAYDVLNPKYTTPMAQYFSRNFTQLGGMISDEIVFNSHKNFSAPDLARRINETKADGLFLVSSLLTSAVIIQHLRKHNSTMTIIGLPGFGEPEFTKAGGGAVEGSLFISEFNADADNDQYHQFKEDYHARFGETVSLASQMGYDASRILLEGLSQTTDRKKLKQVILSLSSFISIDGQVITFDSQGDPLRPLYIHEIREGKVITTGKIEPPGNSE